MSLQMECNSKWNVTQNGMSLNMEGHSKLKLIKIKYHSILNVTLNGTSLKMERHSNQNVTLIGISLILEHYLNKAKAISAKLLDLNWKNKLDEKGEKLEEAGRNRKKRRNGRNTKSKVKTMPNLFFCYLFKTHLVSFLVKQCFFLGENIFFLVKTFFSW